jgi:hypothetical protein
MHNAKRLSHDDILENLTFVSLTHNVVDFLTSNENLMAKLLSIETIWKI